MFKLGLIRSSLKSGENRMNQMHDSFSSSNDTDLDFEALLTSVQEFQPY